MRPKARGENLTVREMAEETLVYDHARARAHCLNRSSALVWRLCDGRTSLEELARRVEQELHVDQCGPLVQLALEQLDRRHLLETAVPRRFARRAALVKLAVAAGALPVVMTLTAPRANAAASIHCRTNANCPSGTTCANGICVGANGQPVRSGGGIF